MKIPTSLPIPEVFEAGKLKLRQANEPAAPTLAFGDGDSGIFEKSDDDLAIAINGSTLFEVLGVGFVETHGKVALLVVAPTATVPNIISKYDDINTGIGTAGEDILSLIAGGLEAMRLTEVAGVISINASGGVTPLAPFHIGTTPSSYTAPVQLPSLLIVDNTVAQGASILLWDNQQAADLKGLRINSNFIVAGDFGIQSLNDAGTIKGTNFYINSAGSIGIGTTAPNANSILDLTSTTKAFMPPRMTSVQKAAIASPTSGMMVYDSTLNKMCIYGAAGWETVTSV